MDKYEFKLKVDEMKALVSARNYKAAAEIAETINWRKIRNLNALVLAGEIFEQVERYEESKEILLLAYDKSPIGRNIIYRLAEIAIKTKNFHEAKEYYDEFVDIAPHDNLKYVLKYKMTAAQGLPYENQIKILEELKEQEYSEEWAYELAYLYHRNRQPDKCVDACDELILWFGDGTYVEKALELKMHYQPLTKTQEEKYRMFRQRRAGVIEVKPDDFLESGEIINETVQIPSVVTNPGRFNTANLQNEIAKGMQQIINAKKKETVSDAMDNIKKLVEDIPYLSMQREETRQESVQRIDRAVDDEIDRQLDKRLNMMLHEPDGRGYYSEPEDEQEPEKPMSTMTIEEVLAEWEKTKQAAKSALQEADERKLESEKEKALDEASALMDRLLSIVPQLTAGVTPKELLEQEYLQGTGVLEREQPDSVQEDLDKAGQIVAGMNELLQKQIDSLLAEENGQQAGMPAEESGQQTCMLAEENGQKTRDYRMSDPTREMPKLPPKKISLKQEDYGQQILRENVLEEKILPEKVLPEPERIQEEEILEEEISEEDMQAAAYEAGFYETPQGYGTSEIYEAPETYETSEMYEAVAETPGIYESPEMAETPEMYGMPEMAETREMYENPETVEATEMYQVPEMAETSEMYETPEEVQSPEMYRSPEMGEEPESAELPEISKAPEIPEASKVSEMPAQDIDFYDTVQQMSEEQKQLFSWYISVDGMESQIYQLIKNVSIHLQMDKNSLTGNIIVEGVSRCGKTELVKRILQVLQKELDRPNKKIGKIHANTLNQKDVAALVKKVSGGCLIIESAGRITRETAVTLSRCMDMDRTGTLYVLEDTKENMVKALDRDSSFAIKFTEKVSIPLFSIDDYAAFGRSYANELNYDIDEMGNLALYKRISNIQRLDHYTSLDEVMEIIDEAISNAEKVTLKKMFGILTATRYNDDRYVVLHEKDFMEI